MIFPIIGAAVSVISALNSSPSKAEEILNKRIDRLSKQLDNMPQTNETRALILAEINSLREERDAMDSYF